MAVLFITIDRMPFLAPNLDNADALFALAVTLSFYLHHVDVADQASGRLTVPRTQNLFSRWYPDILMMFYKLNKRYDTVPKCSEKVKFDHFYNCAATVMTEELQELALISISDYFDLIIAPPVEMYSLRMTIIIMMLMK